MNDPGAPLTGIRVLDLSRVLAGPFCTLQLADMGAEVIKIEKPAGGDDTRNFKPPDAGGEAHYFLAMNRNRRSVALDIRTAEGREVIHGLAAKCDVLVENFRPGVMARHGLDYASLAPRHPHLVYCAISAYGQVSPMADRPGFDPVLQAESGMMSVTGEAEGEPMRHPLAIVDTVTALYASTAILGALVARERTGRGQRIDLALLDSAVSVLTNAAQYYLVTGENPGRMGNAHQTAVPVGLFPTRTGPLYIAVGTDRLFGTLCRGVLDRPDLAEDPRFAGNPARQAHREILVEILLAAFAAETREHWLAKTREAGLPAGAVRTVAEALESPEIAAREMVRTLDHPTAGRLRMLGSPLRFSDTPVVAPTAPPLLGEHTEEVLSEVLGLDADAVAALRDAGAIP